MIYENGKLSGTFIWQWIVQAPSSLLEALEGHLANLEGRKPGSGGATPTSGGHR